MCGFVAERAHILPETARRDESGQLWTGGVPLPRLAEQYGTPLYLYDVATIRAAIAAYRHGLESYPGETALVYAAKAFAAVGLLRLLASEGLGVDCVSEGNSRWHEQPVSPPSDWCCTATTSRRRAPLRARTGSWADRGRYHDELERL